MHTTLRERTLIVRRSAVGIVVVAGLCAGLVVGAPTRQGQTQVPLAEVDAACATDNPFVTMVCIDKVIVFQNTLSDQPHYQFGYRFNARESDIGAVWGLAYSSREHAIYAAAMHRRGIAFGPGGPGAVYRIDLATGDVTQPITVPNAGENHHFPDARAGDVVARNWAGKTSLGDIDLDEGETELFVTNLEDRRIYRFRVSDGMLLGSFATGGIDEPWADDARPWGLMVRAGVVYHGVINSAENSQRAGDLAVHVFASQPDGSAMVERLSAQLPAKRPGVIAIRGRADGDWNAWSDGSLRQQENIRPMPIVSDLAIDATGNLVIGLKDRLGDLTLPNPPAIISVAGDGAGLALGDLMLAAADGPGWRDIEPLDQLPSEAMRRLWSQGGLAVIRGGLGIVTDALSYEVQEVKWEPMATWYSAADGTLQGDEFGCVVAPLPRPLAARRGRVLAAPALSPLQDNENYSNSAVPGDVELLCPPSVHPTATPTETPLISPTPSSTRTPSPTRTQTPTPTDTATETPTATPSPTREPAPIYLPITLTEPRCLPIHPKLDIILVLDASTSMRELTRAGRPKIDAAVAAARDFLTRLNLAPDGDHAGLVSFNAAATLDSPLTADRAALDVALGRVALAQFTRIDLGLDAAAAELAGPRRRADATAAVVLLTDGRSNPVPVSEAERAAGVVKAAGARLFTIGLGQDVDAEALRAMASQAADYFEAPDGEDLGAIYGAISAALPCAPYSYWP